MNKININKSYIYKNVNNHIRESSSKAKTSPLPVITTKTIDKIYIKHWFRQLRGMYLEIINNLYRIRKIYKNINNCKIRRAFSIGCKMSKVAMITTKITFYFTLTVKMRKLQSQQMQTYKMDWHIEIWKIEKHCVCALNILQQ